MNAQQITETARNLAFAWKGTDTMHSADAVRLAVEATGDVDAADVPAVVEALVPLLRREGLLVELVVVGLAGGDSSDARAAVCVDLDRGNVTGGEEWAALVRPDRVAELVEQTCAKLVRGPVAWDGARFGDGNGGTVEIVDGQIQGAGLYAPALRG